MRLSTAQDLSFQDLPYICLPSFAQTEVERYLSGSFSCNEISNVNQFISNTTTRLPSEQLASLLSKIADEWVFLVYSAAGELPAEALVSLKTNLDAEPEKCGLQVEHWTIHPELSGSNKFSAELLIQRLTYHERIYGVTPLYQDKSVQEQPWPTAITSPIN